MEALENVQDKEQHNVDDLTSSLINFVEKAELNAVFRFLQGIDKILKIELFGKPQSYEISGRFGWLLLVSLKAVKRLISNKHKGALSVESFYLLMQAPVFNEYGDYEIRLIKDELSNLVPDWKGLNYSLFWYNVKETRQIWTEENENFSKYAWQIPTSTLKYVWQVSPSGHYWNFNKDDFDVVIKDIIESSLLEDRLIALSLAFELYKENGCSKTWLAKIEKALKNNENLRKQLEIFLDSLTPSPKIKKWQQSEAKREFKYKQQEKERQKKREKFSKWLSEHHHELRDNGLGKGVVSTHQYYLYQEMRERVGENGTTGWAIGNWKYLIENYGLETAQAFRDGMLNFWKHYTPKLRSEKDEKNTVAVPIIFGLSGLAIEAMETQGWPQTLNEADAALACRYAFHELNGFPNWFPNLYRYFPEVINQLILKEIDCELEAEEKKDYILTRISWSCAWLWDNLAPALLAKMNNEPLNAENLRQALKIIQGSPTVSDDELSKIAAEKCKTLNSLDNLSHWFSVWIGTDADPAIKNFSNYLETLNGQDPLAAKNFAMRVIVNLVGERHIGSSARENFKKPDHLKELYFLTHKYVKVEEDIDRVGKGVYSPELRDAAQDARSRLFSMLMEIRGKKSFLAMLVLSKKPPVEDHRLWMERNAKKCAELDADIFPWTREQFLKFNNSLESIPANHRELFDLIVQRILDLKHWLEAGDDSIAATLAKENEEKGIKKVIASWCRDRSKDKYTVAQEDELADGKKTDLRFMGVGFDAPVPVELKLADNWSGPHLFERLENQLVGDYLRDGRSNRGIFVLVYRGEQSTWKIKFQEAK